MSMYYFFLIIKSYLLCQKKVIKTISRIVCCCRDFSNENHDDFVCWFLKPFSKAICLSRAAWPGASVSSSSFPNEWKGIYVIGIKNEQFDDLYTWFIVSIRPVLDIVMSENIKAFIAMSRWRYAKKQHGVNRKDYVQ